MDILLSKFVKKYLDKMNQRELKDLENFLEFEDEVILNFYNFNKLMKISIKIVSQKFLKILRFNSGEGFEPTNELPRCWFSRPVLSTAQPPLLIHEYIIFTTKVNK